MSDRQRLVEATLRVIGHLEAQIAAQRAALQRLLQHLVEVAE